MQSWFLWSTTQAAVATQKIAATRTVKAKQDNLQVKQVSDEGRVQLSNCCSLKLYRKCSAYDICSRNLLSQADL